MGTTSNRQKEAKESVDNKLALSVPDRALLEELAIACNANDNNNNKSDATFQYAFALSKSSQPSELRYAVTILDGLVSDGYEHQKDCMYGAATALYLLKDYEQARVRLFRMRWNATCALVRSVQFKFTIFVFSTQARCEAMLRAEPNARIAKELHLAAIEAQEQQNLQEAKKAAAIGVAGAAAIGIVAGVVSLLLHKR
jgi:fission 1 protein